MGAETMNPFPKNLGHSVFHDFLKTYIYKGTPVPTKELFDMLLATSVSSSPQSCAMGLDQSKIWNKDTAKT